MEKTGSQSGRGRGDKEFAGKASVDLVDGPLNPPVGDLPTHNPCLSETPYQNEKC